MILSSHALYAARLLKSLNYEKPRAIYRIAKDNPDISEVFLQRIASLLRRAGLVNSTRGAGGGYTLTGKTITLKDLMVATTSYEVKADPIAKELDAKLKEIIIVG